jgi:hypothetical protein
MANSFRGELEIELAGVKYTLRPSFQGLLEIEDKCGCGIMELVHYVSQGKITTKQSVGIIYGGIIGGGGVIDYSELGDLCVEQGMLSVGSSAAVFLGMIVKVRQKKTPKEEKNP